MSWILIHTALCEKWGKSHTIMNEWTSNEGYTCQIIALFIHCNEAMKISKSLQWKQWNCKREKWLFWAKSHKFFQKITPPLGFLLQFWCVSSFSKLSNFKAKKTSQKAEFSSKNSNSGIQNWLKIWKMTPQGSLDTEFF